MTLKWEVNSTSAQTVTLTWRYANGGDAARPATLTVNDAAVGTLAFDPTTDWDTWTTLSTKASFAAGSNTINLSSDSDEGPANIDSLTVSGQEGLSVEDCRGSDVVDGVIRIDDQAPGWASMNGGTTGGGTNLSSATTVSNMSALTSAVSGSSSKIVLVEPGNYSGALRPGSNTTIIGTAPGVKITGSMSISGSSVSNVIVRNIAIQGEHCDSYEACKAGADAVYVGGGAHNVWLDHLDVSDGQDGNCDITQAGDFVTVSWSNFYYTYDKEHRYSNLIAGGDDETNSDGKLNITYMNCHWGDRVDSRQPRGRFGNIHMLNNYHNTGGGQIHGVGYDMALIAENCVYDENRSIWTDMGSPRGWKGIGNIGSGSDLNDSYGTVFTIPYDYDAMPATEVVAAVMSMVGGAGNTVTLEQ